jgi:hypothetical protein
MAILKLHHVPGITKQEYDELSSQVADSQRGADGFQVHYAAFDDDGVLTVIEVWDSVADHDKYYDANIRPHVPADASAPEFAQLHSSRSR